jgi:hypothetical protein
MKRWLSELRELDARRVHQLREVHPLDLLGYINSIVDHNEQFHRHASGMNRCVECRLVRVGRAASAACKMLANNLHAFL